MVPDVWGLLRRQTLRFWMLLVFVPTIFMKGQKSFYLFGRPDVEVNAALETLPQIKVIPLTMHIGPLKERAQRILNRDNLATRAMPPEK